MSQEYVHQSTQNWKRPREVSGSENGSEGPEHVQGPRVEFGWRLGVRRIRFDFGANTLSAAPRVSEMQIYVHESVWNMSKWTSNSSGI